MRIPAPLPVNTGDVVTLRSLVEDGTASAAALRRARIVLLAWEGCGPAAIAAELNCSRQTVITWRERYRSGGIAALSDAARSGRPATVNDDAVITSILVPPEVDAARWSTRLLAAKLGISNAAVANVWRTWGVTPAGPGWVHLETDPVMNSPVSSVVGLSVDPRMRVLAVLIGDPHREGMKPVTQRPDPGSRLAELDPREPSGGCREELGGFLESLGERAAADTTGAALRLIVEGMTEPLRYWAATRPGVVLHVVPPALSWVRLARVACLLAGASESGAESVRALCRAAADRRPTDAFSWVRPE